MAVFATESKSGAMRGLMLNGKSFGMSTHGRFVLVDRAHLKLRTAGHRS
jgi:hypothetical protein